MKQEEQRNLLRNMRPDAYNQQQYQNHMMRMQNGAAMNMGVKPGNNLQRAAMANNQKYVLHLSSILTCHCGTAC